MSIWGAAGDRNYRAWIGDPERYDLATAAQFCFFLHHGLREDHKFLDIGCGSLRLGRLVSVYLRKGNYFGIEPNAWALREYLETEWPGVDFIKVRHIQLSERDDFRFPYKIPKIDFANAHSIFSHASQAQVATCLASVHDYLKPGGKFFATYLEGDHDYDGDEWVYPHCVNYTLNTMIRLGASVGFIPKVLDEKSHEQRWILFEKGA